MKKPNARPILIVRELSSLEHNTLNECFQVMERTKEGGILIPFILETSDMLWFEVSTVKKSRMSFEPYFIKEMTCGEAKEEFVDK